MEKEKRKQNFHSIDMLPFFLEMIDDGISGTASHYADLMGPVPAKLSPDAMYLIRPYIKYHFNWFLFFNFLRCSNKCHNLL